MDDLPAIVAIDANVLVCACQKKGDRREKVWHLLESIDKKKGKVTIPTPAIAEFLVHADQAALAVLDALQKKASISIANFDLGAAHENAQLDAAAIGRKDKRDGSEQPWQKVKIDRQIVAIAKANGAKLIVSDDAGVRANATRVGIRAMQIDDLPIPDHARQRKLPIKEPKQPRKK
ncbi:PIN domain-containing protein [Pseudomonas sp. Hp2]|uniref:PIN domain-containing protein n=1 Tax=Pseudomonas sp. Hp2 TaxID=701189 RepID=UPI00112EA481|nr:PIN domain-containing protein [Pseudomonas sp. Hp2]